MVRTGHFSSGMGLKLEPDKGRKGFMGFSVGFTRGGHGIHVLSLKLELDKGKEEFMRFGVEPTCGGHGKGDGGFGYEGQRYEGIYGVWCGIHSWWPWEGGWGIWVRGTKV